MAATETNADATSTRVAIDIIVRIEIVSRSLTIGLGIIGNSNKISDVTEPRKLTGSYA
jgi:hypothetical protein